MRTVKIAFAALFVCAFLALAPQRASAETDVARQAGQTVLPWRHWTYVVLDRLDRSSIIEQRPGGLGEGPGLSRYELAVVVARLLDKFGDDPARFQLPTTSPDKPVQTGKLEAIDGITALCTELRAELKRLGMAEVKKWQLQ